eukprot:CAMPEP_0201511360 /NCGR_PEP_ID=MMETSP0161_2-20130828/3837_1 /ASSEMBLY_ACC=CAM_ASM_000251 /TAXON_ID=180227 /ORGANISM="Neoparamoeba aestuarina, Strain SoJaBio B1-5/56/2" /LENGTH=469 /DNA_ID=CAMNT_0047906827 /DNA_START=95 /DNA_END=1504 /DNA_ORIENTATION=+
MPEDKKQGAGTPQGQKRAYGVLNRSTSKRNATETKDPPVLKKSVSKGVGGLVNVNRTDSPRGKASPRSDEAKQKQIDNALSSWGTQTDINNTKKTKQKQKRTLTEQTYTSSNSSNSRRRSIDEGEGDGGMFGALEALRADPGSPGHGGTVGRNKPPKREQNKTFLGMSGMNTARGKEGGKGKRRPSSSNLMEDAANQMAISSFLQIKDFKNYDINKSKELLESLCNLPAFEDDNLLGVVRQMVELFDSSPCKERREICDLIIRLHPAKLLIQTLLILSANNSDENFQRKSANLLSSVVAAVFYNPDAMGGRTVFDEIMKESEYLVYLGNNDTTPFISTSFISMVQLIDSVPMKTHITNSTASEEAMKKEFDKKMDQGNHLVLLGWILVCTSEFHKLIVEDSKMTDTILDLAKKETGLIKALALIALFRLFVHGKYKTSSSFLQEIADQAQEQTIKNLALELKATQKRKK